MALTLIAVSADSGDVFDAAFDKLRSVGILSSYSERGSMTKGEFVSVLASIYKTDTADYRDKTFFFDVYPKHPYSNQINKLAAHGVLKGDNDKMFYPDNNVTVQDAVIILVKMLGYERMAAEKGVYPSNYLTLSPSISIMSGVTTDYGKNLNSRDMVVMISNSLDIDMLVQGAYGDNEEYKIAVGQTILKGELEIYEYTGILWGIGEISHKEPLLKDTAKVGDLLLYLNYGDAARYDSFIGHRVKIYYKKKSADSDQFVLLGMQTTQGSKSMTINARDIELFGENSIRYILEDSDKERTVRFADDISVIYNNRLGNDISFSQMNLKDGTVTLIAPDGGEYRYMRVVSYKEYVVKNVSKDTFAVADKYGVLPALITFKDDNEFVMRGEDGAILDMADIQIGDVLEAAVDWKETYWDITVVRNSVSGSLDEYSVDEDGHYLVLSGRKYRSSYMLEQHIASNKISIPDPNDNITLTLNIWGEFADVEITGSTDYKVALLVAVSEKDRENPMDGGPVLKIYTSGGKMEIMKLKMTSDKISFNDKKISRSDFFKIITGNDVPDLSRDDVRMVIRYKQGSDGRITELEYPMTYPAGESPSVTSLKMAYEKGTEDTDGIRELVNLQGSSNRYRSGSRNFGGKVIMAENSTIFLFPSSISEDRFYFIKGMSYFSNNSSYPNPNSRPMRIFTVQKKSFTGTIMMYLQESAGSTSDSTPLAVVTKVTKTVNSDGVPVNKLYAMRDGKEVVTEEKEYGSDLDSCKPGDVIRYANTGQGYVGVVNKYYSYSDDKWLQANASMPNTNFPNGYRIIYAAVDKVYGNVAKFMVLNTDGTVPASPAYEYVALDKFRYYYLLNGDASESNRVSLSDMSALKDMESFPFGFSRVVLHIREGDPSTMVIINR